MKIIYIWDAYCGWCYGFDQILKPFIQNHPEIDFEMVSGGLFDQGKPISAYPHIPGANVQIAQLYGVAFGPAYEELLADGQLILSSYHAAAGFGLLRNQLDSSQHINLASELQAKFYQNGQSLSDPKIYLELADQYGLDKHRISTELETLFAQEHQIHPDYAKARAYGVQSYPTLLIEYQGQLYNLRGNAQTSQELENNLQILLSQ